MSVTSLDQLGKNVENIAGHIPLEAAASLPLGIAQFGAGIAGFRRGEELASALRTGRDASIASRRRAGVRRAGTIRAQFAHAGVDVNQGSPLERLREEVLETNRATQQIYFNFERRRERALSEGMSDLAAGLGVSASTFLGGYQSVLDARPTTEFDPTMRVLDEPENFRLLTPLAPTDRSF